jgi:Glycoside-hydrolase family GH114
MVILGGFGGAQSKASEIVPLPVNGVYDSQLGGAYDPDPAVTIVSRDRSDAPIPGLYSVCYINAFQTQANESAWWKANHPELLLHASDGSVLEDANWPGEIILDPSTVAKREAILSIVGPWIDGCAAHGFQAVEPDNLDTWTRSGGALTMDDNVAMAILLAARAHAQGLAIAQKNSAELGAIGRDHIGFDFAITEACQVYDECGDYAAVYGSAVLEIEYTDGGRSAFEAACAADGDMIAIVLRDRNLSTPDDPDYAFTPC